MNLFNEGLFQLLKLIVLPVLIGFSLLLWLLGTLFLWSFCFFITGSIFLLLSFKWIGYRPNSLNWLDRRRIFKRPQRVTFFVLILCWLVALHVSLLSFVVSKPFCLAIFGAYLTCSWIFYRLILAHLPTYTRLLAVDAFNVNYWFIQPFTKKSNPPPRSIPKRIRAFLNYKQVRPTQQIRAINLLFKRKYFHSIIEIQKNLFRYFDSVKFRPEVQDRILQSIHQIAQEASPEIKAQQEQQWELFFTGRIKRARMELLLDAQFLGRWHLYAQKQAIHQLIIHQFYNYIGTELSNFIAHPNLHYFELNVLEILKSSNIEQQSEQILEKITFTEDPELQYAIQYAYNMLLIVSGIAKNLQ